MFPSNQHINRGRCSLNTTCITPSIMIHGIPCSLSSGCLGASSVAVIHDVRAAAPARCQMLKALFSLIQPFLPALCILWMFSQNRVSHFMDINFHNSLLSGMICFVSSGKVLSPMQTDLSGGANYQIVWIDHSPGQHIPTALWVQGNLWNRRLQLQKVVVSCLYS